MALDRENKLITGENLCERLDLIEDGYTIRDSNLSQQKARTPIKGKGLTFIGCNLKNCILPEDARHEDCLYNPSDKIDNLLQQDIIIETPEQIAEMQKRMEIEQVAVESFRTDIKAEIAKASMVTATAETIKAAVVASAKTAVGK